MLFSFLIALVGFCFLIYSKYEIGTKKKKARIIGIILFVQVFLFFWVNFKLMNTMQNKARKEFVTFLDYPDLKVKINDVEIKENSLEQTISSLRNIRYVHGHHSHPEEEIEIIISSKEKNIKIKAAQDSEIKTEYWIFWDKYESTKLNEIGRIEMEN